MIYVYLLTDLQKDDLIGQCYAPDSFFNPIQDAIDDWVISIEEVENCINPDFMWIKNLPLIEFIPKSN